MKNLHKILLIGCLSAGMVLTTGCDVSDFGDTNVNPNATETPVTSALLTNAMNGVFRSGVVYNLNNGLYCQYFAETQYTEASLYNLTQPAWDGIYAGHLYDLENIILINTNPATAPVVTVNGSNNNQIAVARILKAYRYSGLTDVYGDIPYSAALKGDPKIPYDAQADVYKGIFKELKEAVAQFDAGPAAKGDVLFNGDIAKWKKFANSWRLILALRISKADAALGRTEFNDALKASGGVIESNSDNGIIRWPGAGFKNPWFSLYDGRKDFAISDVIVNTMNDLKDPRVKVFGTPNNKGEIVPMPYGLTRDLAVSYTNSHPDFSYILAQNWRNQDSPMPVLTAGQVLLARAEAAQLGWTTENAANLYKAGIKASWEEWGVYSQESYDAYLADPKVDLAAGNAPAKIGLQRWLAFYPNGLQGYSEWRRTGYPDLKPTQYATNASKKIPRRWAYPVTEPNLNGEAYQAAVGKLSGGDTQDSRVWWDKQ